MAALALALIGGPGFAQQRVTEIQVSGTKRIEVETVRSYMTIGPGDAMDARRVDESLKALFATGLFADVSIARAGSRLIVNVVENPIINRLAFEGNRRIDDETLSAEVQLRPRTVFTRSRIQSDVQRLLQVYQRSGRYATTVEPKVIQLAQNRVDLIFEITEGPATGIRRISFVGNRRFSDGRLRGAIATRESRWYRFFTSDDTYDPDRLAFDQELLRRYYLKRGYADFRVTSAVAELSPSRQDLYVTFAVEEGEPYRFGPIAVKAALKDLDPTQLMAFVSTTAGEAYDAEAVERSVEALTFEVGRLGYAFVDIKPKLDRDRDARTIGVSYEINEGPRVYVERIDIVGNVRTLDEVIRREFKLVEGDAFNTAKLQASRRGVRSLAFFKNVNVENQPGSAPDKSNILVTVEEQSTGELSVGAGISTTEALVGDISIRERNLLGQGQDLRAALNLSTRRQFIDVSFTEPYFLDRNVAAGFDAFRRQRDLQDESSFNQKQVGFVLRAGFPIFEGLRQSLNYSFNITDVTDVGAGASRFIREQEGRSITSSVGYSIEYDARDDVVDPTEGWSVRFGQDLAGLAGNVRFLRTRMNYEHYIPVIEDLTAVFALEEGYIFGLGQDVNINNRFFVGASNFRGFERAGIGPRDLVTDDALGGNLYYIGTAEARFPLGLPEEFGLFGRVFTEFGSLGQVDEDGAGIFDVGSPRVSTGVGITWRSPFGPVQLDAAYAAVKEDVDKTQPIRFTFGTRF
ncbi:MAG: outer membrane protein assembly factor BamA [Alphaproteobacteria bacterium]|nr:outer membrane protein assembly factor BamA [Alphaproteobacteria bacterium]